MSVTGPSGPRPVHVFRWDLDKTYLRTEFDSMRDLMKSALEKASDKRAVPGAPTLLKALRAAGGRGHRICIVSGSPSQMRRVLEAKLALDGVEWDEFVLKPNLTNILRGRFRALRAQIPYKLPALLASHVAQPAPRAGETLFGDDAESDALVYSLYADLLAGRVRTSELEQLLEAAGAYDDEREQTLALTGRLAPAEIVQRILIHLDKRSAPAFFDQLGPRVVPIYNYFQGALVLYGDGRLSSADVVAVARAMLSSGEYQLPALANSLQDLIRRGQLDADAAENLALAIQDPSTDQAFFGLTAARRQEIAWLFATRVRELGKLPAAKVPQPKRIDYVRLVAGDHARRKAQRRID